MNITNVSWNRDHAGRAVLDLSLNGHRAHISCSQRDVLLRSGIVDGMVYLRSDRPSPGDNPFIRGSYQPGVSDADLMGCTDDPGVFALFTTMCTALREGTWASGPRISPA